MRRRLRAAAARTFRSLRVRNYRLYFSGQLVSMAGTWMQTVAQDWLVLKLSGNNGVDLGLVTALQFLPVLVAGPWGGVIADRVDKRRTVTLTQMAAGALALALGLLTLTGVVTLWMVFVVAFLLGCVNLVDMPTRQAFVMEMVGRDDLANAVSLNSVVVNAARVVGPAVAGVLIAMVGIAACFLINAASYGAVVAAFLMMRSDALYRDPPVARKKGQLREGLRYAWSHPELRTPLLLMAVVGTLAYNFRVVFPLLAKITFHAGAGTYGGLYAVMGGGAVVGGLVIAARSRATHSLLTGATLFFGAALLATAFAPHVIVAYILMFPLGAASTAFIATSNALLQLNASTEMRGRVMALFSLVFLGSTPIGGPLIGWISQVAGPRVGLAVGAVATLVAGVAGLFVLRRPRRRRPDRQEPERVATPVEASAIAAAN